LRSILSDSKWIEENGVVELWFTDSDVCMLRINDDKPIDSKFTYSVSNDQVFLNPEDFSSTFLSLGASKLNWTLSYEDGYLTTEIKEGQLKFKRVN
jgi:hypothetical protein